MTRAISPRTRRSAHLSYAAGFLVIIVTLEILVRYERYARVLEVLSLALLACVATAFSVPVDWRQALAGLVPTLRPGHRYATALVAIAGTTMSPYLLFWQAGQEAEITQRDSTKAPLIARPAHAPCELRRIRFDTYVGMALSQIVAFFIIVTAAATLGAHGIVRVDTAGAAASAPAPLAGPWTAAVFAAGLVATGLLAIPAMAAACAYALAGMWRWPQGLGAPIRAAPALLSGARVGGHGRSWYRAVAVQLHARALLERRAERTGGRPASRPHDDPRATVQRDGPFRHHRRVAHGRMGGHAGHGRRARTGG